jgi:zinc protease
MKHSLALLLCVVALATAAGAAPAADGLRLPPFRKVTLPNGLTCLLMERRAVPLVSVHVTIRAGSVADPDGREGLALLTAELLRHGTRHRTADQIASELDFMGAALGTGGDPDRVWLTSEFMAKDAAAAFDLIADLLQHPTFPAAEVKKLVQQSVDGIKQDKEEASAVLPLYFAAALYGRHPYGRPPGGDERSLAAIRRADVAHFYDHHCGPRSTLIAVAGDFTSADIEKLLTAKFGGWKTHGETMAPPPPVPSPAPGLKLLLVDKPDSPQTYFAIGQVGIARDNPDRTAIGLVNLLFGGRFTSMLNEALRVNSGLTYGARSSFVQRRVAGPFTISSFTATATTTNAIDLALEVLQRLHREGITDDQLRSAKEYFKGQYPPRIESTDQLASLLAELEFYGLDEREVNELFQRVDGITAAEARRLIQQYFPREKLVFTLVGKAADIEASVKKYAPTLEKRAIDQPGFK